MKRIMFVCKKNSRRSQMAEAFAKLAGKDRVIVTSSGLTDSAIDPLVVQVMSEIGIDISQQTSKPLSDFRVEDFDVVISLCGCGVNLPTEWLLRERFEDWEITDPEGHEIETFRQVRDEIKQRIINLIDSM